MEKSKSERVSTSVPELEAEELEFLNEDATDSKRSREPRLNNFGCGCGSCTTSCFSPIVICFVVLAAFSAFVVDRCSPDTMLSRSADTVTNLLKELGTQKKEIFTEGIIVNNISGDDKYVAARIEETVSKTCKSTNFKLTATYKIDARANFEYWVDLASFRLRFEYAPNGKIRAVANFGELKLSEPVAYKVLSQKSSTRPFVVDFDAMQSDFMNREFPNFLFEEGSNMKSMLAAKYMAQRSIEKLLRNKIFPLLGIDKNFARENISEIVVNFNGVDESEGDSKIEMKLK